jgi:CO/xanthine dehydrogenase FAD-binding subunit
MTRIRSYHRPSSLGDALALLTRPDVATAPIAGGTVLNGLPESMPEEVVDLQALGLDEITRNGATLRFGATARLQDVVDHEWTPPVLRDLARGEAPNTLRNAATVGGTVGAADPESRFLAGLLAFGATATIASSEGEQDVAVANVLADRSVLVGSIIVAVSIDVDVTAAASAGTARTPADTPIVLVAGCDRGGAITLAATGVAKTPVRIDLNALDALDPPGDFRGSPEYRRHLAGTLGARVVASMQEGGAA